MKIISLTNNFNDKPIYFNAEDIAVFFTTGSKTTLKLKNDSEQYQVFESPEEIILAMKKTGIEVGINSEEKNEDKTAALDEADKIQTRIDELSDSILALERILRSSSSSPEKKTDARIKIAEAREDLKEMLYRKDELQMDQRNEENALPAHVIR